MSEIWAEILIFPAMSLIVMPWLTWRLLQTRYFNSEKPKMHMSQYTNDNVWQVKLFFKSIEKCVCLFACLFQSKNRCMILDYICFEHYALGGHVKIFLFKFLQLVIPAFGAHELIIWNATGATCEIQ
jgi:hypothetical protein